MQESKGEKGLNMRQLLFIDNILMGMRQRKAYIMAGFRARNNSVADANASRLISNDKVSAEISRRKKEVVDRCSILLLRMSTIALDTLFEIMQNGTRGDRVRAEAAKDILDRADVRIDAKSLCANEPRKIIVTYEDEKKEGGE